MLIFAALFLKILASKYVCNFPPHIIFPYYSSKNGSFSHVAAMLINTFNKDCFLIKNCICWMDKLPLKLFKGFQSLERTDSSEALKNFSDTAVVDRRPWRKAAFIFGFSVFSGSVSKHTLLRWDGKLRMHLKIRTFHLPKVMKIGWSLLVIGINWTKFLRLRLALLSEYTIDVSAVHIQWK